MLTDHVQYLTHIILIILLHYQSHINYLSSLNHSFLLSLSSTFFYLWIIMLNMAVSVATATNRTKLAHLHFTYTATLLLSFHLQ